MNLFPREEFEAIKEEALLKPVSLALLISEVKRIAEKEPELIRARKSPQA